MTTTFTSQDLGKVVLSTYVDPHPGMKGTDRVQVECGMCHEGVYQGHSGITWERRWVNADGKVVKRVDTKWCFYCGGTNKRSISVSTARKYAKQDAFRAEFADQLAAKREAAAIEANARIAAAEFEAAWVEAHAENDRRNAMVQGFLGEVDAKVSGLVGTVQVAKYLSGSYNRSARMFVIVNLDGGQVVKICASSESLFDLERGDRVELSGKVKRHDNHNGQDQTELYFVKAKAIEEEAA